MNLWSLSFYKIILKKTDQDQVNEFKGRNVQLPKFWKVAGEVEVPFPESNPVLDFNYTKEKCSFQRVFPLSKTATFDCTMKSNLVFSKSGVLLICFSSQQI